MLIKRILSSFLLIVLPCALYAQSSESGKLLFQAEEMVFYNPQEVKTISDHVLKNVNNEVDLEKSLYLSAVASYVIGDYDEALVLAFESKEKSERSKDQDGIKNSIDLINRISKFLLLDTIEGVPSKRMASGFFVEDFVKKSELSLSNNNIDSAHFYLSQAEEFLNFKHPGYSEALYYSSLGEIEFKNKNWELALSHYLKADSIEQYIRNPFLLEEINRKLATNYLAMDSLSQFQYRSELVKEMNTKTSAIENRAANQLHRLTVADLDEKFIQKEKRFQYTLYGILSLLAVVILMKTVFYFRNRNKLKMYEQMLSYLESQQKAEKKSEVVLEETVVKKEKTIRASTLLKESELQILDALEKFELTKKFTNKDMSLGMLASELNTNTKYLSEVINRHKKKNFNAYINELRINYITEKIKNEPTYLNYKVSYLGEECGYSSHSTFTTVFKSIVGVSPIMFVEFVREESNKESISS